MKNGRIKPLVAGLLIYLLIGLIYGWSIFVAPLEAEFGWSRAQTSAVFTISMIFFCLGGIVSGIIIKKKTARFILTVAAICLCAGFCCASSIHTVGGLYIAYGVLCGTGVGLAYNCNISTVLKWFPDRAGLISGLLLMCFGCGGMVLGTLASSLIQMIGWRITFVILGLLFAALILICAIWIKNPPENLFSRQGQDVREKSAILKQKKKAEKKHPEIGVEMKAGQMLKRPAFWLHFIWATLLSAAGLAVIGHASVCAQDLGAAVGIATLITGLISVFNGIGRVVIGWKKNQCGDFKSYDGPCICSAGLRYWPRVAGSFHGSVVDSRIFLRVYAPGEFGVYKSFLRKEKLPAEFQFYEQQSDTGIFAGTIGGRGGKYGHRLISDSFYSAACIERGSLSAPAGSEETLGEGRWSRIAERKENDPGRSSRTQFGKNTSDCTVDQKVQRSGADCCGREGCDYT